VDSADSFVSRVGIRDLFRSMENSSSPVPPFMMLNVLHMCFPRFAEKSEQGVFQQQVRSLIRFKNGYILSNFK